MARLPLDRRGYPVPWFVAWIDDEPDFRVIRPGGFVAAAKGLCWLCGEPMGRFGTFVVGPMCGINRVSSEPPSHLDCADYAARACPFMTRPMAVRNERDMPSGIAEPGGMMIKRNPGVCLVWTTREWRPFRVAGGALVRMGDPTDVRFYREGRRARRAEIDASIDSGYPLLFQAALQDGPNALALLEKQKFTFETFLPREVAP